MWDQPTIDQAGDSLCAIQIQILSLPRDHWVIFQLSFLLWLSEVSLKCSILAPITYLSTKRTPSCNKLIKRWPWLVGLQPRVWTAATLRNVLHCEQMARSTTASDLSDRTPTLSKTSNKSLRKFTASVSIFLRKFLVSCCTSEWHFRFLLFHSFFVCQIFYSFQSN